jgi:hypothetical protein
MLKLFVAVRIRDPMPLSAALFTSTLKISLYQVSKVGVSALSIIQQRTLDAERPREDIAVNHVHPG